LTGGGSTLGIKTIPMPAHDAAEIETPIRVGSGGECQPPVSPGGEARLICFSARFLITRTLTASDWLQFQTGLRAHATVKMKASRPLANSSELHI
jgi:hypothetical protein